MNKDPINDIIQTIKKCCSDIALLIRKSNSIDISASIDSQNISVINIYGQILEYKN